MGETGNSEIESPVSRSIVQDLILRRRSPEPMMTPNHVVVVMDGLKEFNMEPLEWVLKNIALGPCCTITLLGVTPWLNIPLSAKTWSDIWTTDLGDLNSSVQDKGDMKYQKARCLVDICRSYGVVPKMKTGRGYPLRLVVVEQITSLHATLVVFDRHHDRKYIEYYAEKVPYNMVIMNDDGEVDVIKGRSRIDTGENTPSESPVSRMPTPKRMISGYLRKILSLRSKEKHRE